MPRQPRSAGRRARQKGRRPPPAPRPSASARPRVGPLPLKAEEQTAAPKPRLPGMMDFSYVKDDLKRIAVVSAAMVALLVVLSFVLH